MSTSPKNQDALRHDAKPRPARQAQPGELLFEFHVEHTKKFWRCELRDHGYGVEAQFFDPVDLVISHRWPTRELAIAWAEAERRSIEAGLLEL